MMEKCIELIHTFLHDNKLCNKGDKTEFIVIGSKNNRKKLEPSSIIVNNSQTKAANKVKNLRILFDKTMTMEKQVNSMCKRAYYNIKNIADLKVWAKKTQKQLFMHL